MAQPIKIYEVKTGEELTLYAPRYVQELVNSGEYSYDKPKAKAKPVARKAEPEEELPFSTPPAEKPLAVLLSGLPSRTVKAIQAAGYDTAKLRRATQKELLEIEGVGRAAVRKIKELVA